MSKFKINDEKSPAGKLLDLWETVKDHPEAAALFKSRLGEKLEALHAREDQPLSKSESSAVDKETMERLESKYGRASAARIAKNILRSPKAAAKKD